MRLLPRLCFTLLFSLACASVIGGAGCTRRGTPAVLPSGSAATSRTLYVNAKSGSDTNNGSQATPLKTLTKALKIATAALATTGPLPVSEIELAVGNYNAANGEQFPLSVPAGVTVNGALYGSGASKGAFINGAGEDTALEKILGAPAHTYYATIEVASTATDVDLNNLYVGATQPGLPSASAVYDAVDLLGSVSATTSSFDSPASNTARVNGILLPGGTLSCTSCAVGGTGYAIAAFSLTSSDCASQTQCPTVTLTGNGTTGQGFVGGTTGIRTDGTANITVSNQTFSSSLVGFADDFPSVAGSGSSSSSSAASGVVDFGQGGGSPQSTGGNILLGAKTTEINVTLDGDTVDAYGDTWNQDVQGTNASGQFRTNRAFAPGASGRNVTVASSLSGSGVNVGPVKQPTPVPSTSASGSPSASPSPSPSPT